MNHRRLSLLALPIFAAAACTADQASAPSATTPTPTALRERLDRLVPSIVDRSADVVAASVSSLGALAAVTGLETEAAAAQPYRAVFFGGPDAGARARAWVDDVLSDDAFDGSVYHLDPAALCGTDDVCAGELASADVEVHARSIDPDGVELQIVSGLDRLAATITLTPGGAHVSGELAALAPVISAVFWGDPGRDGRVVDMAGAVEGDLQISADVDFRVHAHGPIRITTRATTAASHASVGSLDLDAGSSLDAHARGHGPVVVDSHLVNVRLKDAGGDAAPVRVDGEVVVQDGAAVSHLDVAAP